MPEKKVLIVDYDRNSLESLVALLKPYEFKIITATDGQTAYELFQKEHPNCVILEAMLPKLHGFDLCQRIYEESKGETPVIIVTGLYKGPQYRQEALRSFGAKAYFEKPFDRQKLVSTVLDLIQEELDIREELPSPEKVTVFLDELFEKLRDQESKK
ncbi:MAG: response regulator [Candidatus Aminicenantes bacterium 4484_214]|nr:MAG: response regulator [Candidatus Aminicenantes bacterium 4484_214]RLE10805.1 MAG: response regulator [Candidatus Aminicenantes bacterium]